MERNRSDEKKSPEQGARIPSGAAVMRASVTEALARAFFAEWADRGFGALSLERVAKRAGVGKAALYRRWSSKHEMAVQLLRDVGLHVTKFPDCGTLEEDLKSFLFSLRRTLRHPLIRRILPDLHAEMARNSALSQEIRATVQFQRRAHATQIIDRAIARGEVPKGANHTLAIDALGSILYWRVIVTGGRVHRADIEEVAEFIAAGLGANPVKPG